VYFSVGKLPSELQMLEEDPSEYKAPQDGNLVYKLFSLNDLLLLVRCSVQKVKSLPRYHKKKKAQEVQILLLSFFCFGFLNSCALWDSQPFMAFVFSLGQLVHLIVTLQCVSSSSKYFL